MIEQNTLENIRRTSILETAERLGYKPRKESTRYYRIKDSNLNLVLDISKNMFFDNESLKKGFGAVSLLIDIFGYSFKDAVQFLNGKGSIDISFSCSKSLKATTLQEKEILINTIPPSVQANLQAVKKYLIDKRKISAALIDELDRQNLLYADKYCNAVFLNLNHTFAFLRGIQDRRFVKNAGEMNFIIYQAGKSDIYLFESVIDLLSFKTLYPERKGTFGSINGSAMINRLFELNLQNYENIFCCFDNDEQGYKFDEKVKAIISTVKIIKSVKKDFNDDLCLKNNA